MAKLDLLLTNQTLQKIYFIVVVSSLSAVLYLRDVQGLAVSKFLILGVVVIYALLADYQHLMMMTAFTLPLIPGLPGNYILPILSVLIVFKGREKTKVPRMVFGLLVLVAVYELLHILFLSSTFALSPIIGYISSLFLLFYIGGTVDVEADDSKNALWFCLGTVVLFIILMISFNQFAGADFVESGVRLGDVSELTGDDTMVLGTNPNNIGLYSIAAISISFTLWYYKRITFWILLLIIIPSFLGGVYCVSRTWMLTMVLFVFLFIVMRKGKRKLSSILVLLVAVLGIYMFFTSVNTSLFEAYTTRFHGDDGTAGNRTTLFTLYNDWMFSHPWALFCGTGALPYREVTSLFESTHNAMQQVFISYGIPGLLLFCYLLYRCIQKWRVPHEWTVYIPILTIGFFLQSTQFLNPPYCSFPLVASFFILKMFKRETAYTTFRTM